MKPKNPADPASRQILFQGSAFAFVREQTRLPNGRLADMAFVDHPGSAAIVPLLRDQRVLLLRQYRHPVGMHLYEIPAGTLESGESPEACAGRELQEETGYTAGRLTALGKTHILPAYSNEIVHFFLARDLLQGNQQLDADEVIEVVPFDLKDALDLIEKGLLTDALSIVGLYHAHRYLKNFHVQRAHENS